MQPENSVAEFLICSADDPEMAESGGSTSHSSSSLSGGSGTEDQVNWKERCHTLEASLHKFKSQAAKIRELLAQKVSRENLFSTPVWGNQRIRVSKKATQPSPVRRISQSAKEFRVVGSERNTEENALVRACAPSHSSVWGQLPCTDFWKLYQCIRFATGLRTT